MFPVMSFQEVAEQIDCEMEREQKYCNVYTKIYSRPQSPASPSLDDTCLSRKISISDTNNGSRKTICTWVFNVIDHYDFNRQTAVVSMDIFDRFMAVHDNRCTPEFALLAATASIFISTKLNEQSLLESVSLAKFSRGQFSTFDIEGMEIEILRDLNWLIHPPTAASFMCPLISFLPSEVGDSGRNIIFEKAQYIAELAIFDPFFVNKQTSSIGLASILITLDIEMHLGCFSPSFRREFLIMATEHTRIQQSESFNLIYEKLCQLVNKMQQVKYHEHYTMRKHNISLTSPKSALSYKTFS